MRIVAMSDTHDRIPPSIPDGDVLVHAGDATNAGTAREVAEFAMWFNDLPHPYKVFVPGNHDFLFEKDPDRARRLMAGTHVLMDKSVTIDDLVFYGSPYTIRYGGWAFMESEADQAARFNVLPRNSVDVLVTHGPPQGILDRTDDGNHAGSKALESAVVETIHPAVHVFGHIHESRGTHELLFGWHRFRFYNVACDDFSEWLREPVVIDL